MKRHVQQLCEELKNKASELSQLFMEAETRLALSREFPHEMVNSPERDPIAHDIPELESALWFARKKLGRAGLEVRDTRDE